MSNKTIGEIISYLRKEKGMTQFELAEKMGISKENVMEAIRLSAENIEDIDIRA